MTNRWRDRLAKVDRAIDRVMTETVRIEPMRDGDFSGQNIDPTRPSFLVDAVLTIWRGEADMGGNAAHLRNAQIRTAKAELQINRALLPAGTVIRKDDRVEAVDQGLVFRVDRVDGQHPGRLALTLSIEGARP